MDLTKGAAFVKENLDGFNLDSRNYGDALRYVLYYLVSSGEHNIKITEELLTTICAEGVQMAKKLNA